MSHRLLRGTVMPFATTLAAALTVLGVTGFAPAIATAAAPAGHGNTARDQEWWLAGLHVTQAWQKTEGSGITVAVLGTGVDASYPGLAGSVITGPDYTGSGRTPGGPYWGVEGTAVAGLIASHERGWGLVGVAPAAKILSIRVTLEFNDPLASDQAISRRLPQAIADGIRYAADHGARIIDLPLDPGTLGLTSKGDPAAAGGNPAERAAVSYALSKGVVLVAPAGDDGQGPGLMNYPAAYSGVIAVGATGRAGQLASFSSRQSYTSLTAPGVSLVTAAPPAGYGTISSTTTASGIVAGLAALMLSRFPHLTVTQVTQALIESTVAGTSGAVLPPLPARSAAGAGYGTVDATRAVDMAAIITTASQSRQQPAPVASPHQSARHAAAAPSRLLAAARRPAASTLAGSVLRDAVAAVAGLIVLLVIALVVARFRRERGRAAAPDRARTRGQHENRKPDRGSAAGAGSGMARDGRAGPVGPPLAGRPGPPAAAGWASPAGWQGGSIGEIRPGSSRPVVAPAPKSSSGYRAGRGPGRMDGVSGPPWAPAPEPRRLIGPLPVASASLPPPEPGRGIRVPRDMAAPPGATTEPEPPVSFDLTTPPADFDLSTPAFGLTPPAFYATPPTFDAASPAFDLASPPFEAAPPAFDAALPPFEAAPPMFDMAPPAFDAAPPASDPAPRPGPGSGPPASDSAQTRTEALPTRQSLGFAAAPVPADYAAPPAGRAPEDTPGRAAAADPSYIWDLAATDVFPAATDAAVPRDDAPEAGEG
ncbi:MAG TPA: S8 family serine peptidase [Streptosporangiaceae bacterium]|nr:S8 family serine peptidase [Streptosporangiaceae bacterium]